jgi:hypothetical protein
VVMTTSLLRIQLLLLLRRLLKAKSTSSSA